ncbi:hypothetical protein PLICRDRAFT_380919 [Plicaturopsis crispa FD-325 SS-3]|nr:hypothetical protein PLICRDRAFT_380919 [Plicaturopsis crispa FD-325 SS-3]
MTSEHHRDADPGSKCDGGHGLIHAHAHAVPQNQELEDIVRLVENLRVARTDEDERDDDAIHHDSSREPVSESEPHQVNLPNEILWAIFSYALPPSDFLDPGLYGGPDSPWSLTLRTKKSFVLVCKAWWSVAMDILYEDVTFRRPGQISAFLRTLETSTFDVESSVRKIKWDISNCPLMPPRTFSALLVSFDRARSLTHLECGSTVFSLWDLVAALRPVRTTLLSLAFELPVIYKFDGLRIQLDRLETLHLEWSRSASCIATSHTMCTTHLEPFINDWSLPALKYLTVKEYTHVEHDDWPFVPYVERFFQAHGARVEYFGVYGWPQNPGRRKPNPPPLFKFQRILDALPALRHFATCTEDLAPFRHPTIEWVDVQSRYALESAHLAAARSALTTENLPALRGVRVIDDGLSALRGISRAIPPKGAEPAFEWRFPGVHICHREGRVYRADMLYHARDDAHLSDIDAGPYLWHEGSMRFEESDDDGSWEDSCSEDSDSDESSTESDVYSIDEGLSA